MTLNLSTVPTDGDRELAATWYRTHVALIEAGFTVEQAFELLYVFVQSTLGIEMEEE